MKMRLLVAIAVLAGKIVDLIGLKIRKNKKEEEDKDGLQ